MDQAPVNGLAGLKTLLRRHFFFLLAFPGILLAAFLIPQVKEIINQNGAASITFVIVFGLIEIYFIASIVVVVPWEPLKGKPLFDLGDKTGRKVFRRIDAVITRMASALLVDDPRRSRLVGLLVAVLGASLWCAPWVFDFARSPFLGAAFRNLGLLSIAISATFLIRGRVDTPQTGVFLAWRRVLAWLSLWVLMGEILWLPHAWGWFGPFPVYTLWALAQIGGFVILAGSFLDFVHDAWPWPVRPVALLLVAATLELTQCSLRVGEAVEDPASPQAVAARWYAHLNGRLDAMDKERLEGPAVLVSVSGGGSRAALFSALVLDALSREPIPDSSSTWGRHILMISGVSGGSLATADFIQREGKISPPNPLPGASVVLRLAEEELELLAAKSPGGLMEARKRVGTYPLQVETVVDMTTDFIAPVLRGTTSPFLGRSRALSGYWTDRLGWGTSSRESGYGGDDYVPRAQPLALYNATDADHGTRLVIGFPPLPPGLIEEGLIAEDPTKTKSSNRTGDLDPSINLTLAEAVLVSANFPWGFPVARLVLPAGAAIRALDGGVVDNSGLDSLHYLFQGLAASKSPAARYALDRLRKRGVLLVEIDSGARPDTGSAWRLFGWLTDPARALRNAATTNTDLARDHHKETLGKILKPGPEPPRVPHVWFRCNEMEDREDVVTTWVLGPKDKAVVYSRFLEQWYEKKDFLAREAQLAKRAKKDVEDAEALARSQEAVKELAESLETAGVRESLMKEILKQETILESARARLDPHSDEAAQVKFEKALKGLRNMKDRPMDFRPDPERDACIRGALQATVEDGRKRLMKLEDDQRTSTLRAVRLYGDKTAPK